MGRFGGFPDLWGDLWLQLCKKGARLWARNTLHAEDDVLVRLRGYLESVNSRIEAGGSVRALEKRQWLVEVETKL